MCTTLGLVTGLVEVEITRSMSLGVVRSVGLCLLARESVPSPTAPMESCLWASFDLSVVFLRLVQLVQWYQSHRLVMMGLSLFAMFTLFACFIVLLDNYNNKAN